MFKISNILFVNVNVMPWAMDRTADKAIKQSTAVIIISWWLTIMNEV